MLRESTTTSTSVSLPVRVVVVLHRFFLIMVNIAFLHRWEVEEGGGEVANAIATFPGDIAQLRSANTNTKLKGRPCAASTFH